ncbi:CRISPR-associated protein Cas6 [Carbonactinospora thermoautotrophica]|uniref:CRISPR-associated protein Cas6 n=1 Tax=Carbonactinospora thermoautotrophica TaxID=1469144 RepID=A0A132NG20_9ACTN|nr:CRISPR-associated endoribonuclease Cas6 [Carbonactinospora thermoautotrophica]KWX05891.1 CRISPR-associated protein Cas6 [Carbonactinospora thermoautotrophica]KWX09074.1 CRISPR-associated protein Cas6 [Carbonactinospora thermoautotrophica]
MRLRLRVRTAADRLPWAEVLRPGRGLCYELLAHGAPELGAQLHEKGWGPYGMVPFGYGAPVFPTAPRRRGVYAAGGPGVLEMGSPLLAVVEAWASGLAGRSLLDWGGVALRLERVEPVEPPAFASGWARLRTATPVVLKGSGRDENGVRTTRQAWLLPGEPEFDVYFAQNLRRKAETLGVDPEVSLERITWVGAKRSFAVGQGLKVGAPVEVELRGAPETLQALWSWGLGQANAAGFGWVVA